MTRHAALPRRARDGRGRRRGPGRAGAERERIFERFQRGSSTGGEEGFGLGLAIGRELAERLGGRLELVDDGAPGRDVRAQPADRAAGGLAPAARAGRLARRGPARAGLVAVVAETAGARGRARLRGDSAAARPADAIRRAPRAARLAGRDGTLERRSFARTAASASFVPASLIAGPLARPRGRRRPVGHKRARQRIPRSGPLQPGRCAPFAPSRAAPTADGIARPPVPHRGRRDAAGVGAASADAAAAERRARCSRSGGLRTV